MFEPSGTARKLIIFTEHRDTLNYLAERIRTLLGRPEAVVTIHGGMGREERRKAQEAFTQDQDVQILVATDAAGEGINLQRAHLMVNYDLPWNPNRLEQRFGRIHRIGQTEVCHLWNLVADETREGEVYQRLLEKLEEQREALGGQVFDVLGQAPFDETAAARPADRGDPLRRPARGPGAAEPGRRRAAGPRRTCGSCSKSARWRTTRWMPPGPARSARRWSAPRRAASSRTSSPAFFLEAFRQLGGTIREREPRRYEITHVPAPIRNRDRLIGTRRAGAAALRAGHLREGPDQRAGQAAGGVRLPRPPAARRDDRPDPGALPRPAQARHGAGGPGRPGRGGPRALFYLEHAIQDARTDRDGGRRVVSRRMQFVEIDATRQAPCAAGYAPYLDYRPADRGRAARWSSRCFEADWLAQDLESRALAYAVERPGARATWREVRSRKEALVTKTMAAVKDRLTKEITYWDHRAEELKAQELAGKHAAPEFGSGPAARRRAAGPPAEAHGGAGAGTAARAAAAGGVGGALVVPVGLLRKLKGERAPCWPFLWTPGQAFGWRWGTVKSKKREVAQPTQGRR